MLLHIHLQIHPGLIRQKRLLPHPHPQILKNHSKSSWVEDDGIARIRTWSCDWFWDFTEPVNWSRFCSKIVQLNIHSCQATVVIIKVIIFTFTNNVINPHNSNGWKQLSSLSSNLSHHPFSFCFSSHNLFLLLLPFCQRWHYSLLLCFLLLIVIFPSSYLSVSFLLIFIRK